MSFTLIFDHLV